MGNIIATRHCPFSLESWQNEDLLAVFAGTEAIMAITDDGRVLRQTAGCAEAMPQSWQNVRSIAMSPCYPGAAIGLRPDGTCVTCGAALSAAHWQNIRQIACSDAFFGLRKDGTVVHQAFRQPDCYTEADSWRGIVRLVTGVQNALFGITADGKVLFTGNPYRTDLAAQLAKLEGVTDLCATGAECTEVVYTLQDGSIHCLHGRIPEITVTAGKGHALASHFWYSVLAQDPSGKLQVLLNEAGALDEVAGWKPVTAFAMGDGTDRIPFAIAITK